MLTMDDLVSAMPATHKRAATPELLHLLNNIGADDEVAENIRNNFISYTSVLQEGKYKMQDYLNAVTFVTLKKLGKNNTDAYAMVHPQRYADLLARGTDSKTMSAYTSQYAGGKLVMAITQQSFVPMWVLNAPFFQEAVMTQVDIMRNSPNDMARQLAANSLMTHLAKPKEVGPQVQINIQNDGTAALADQMQKLVAQQKESIRLGTTARDIAATPMMKNDKEVIDV